LALDKRRLNRSAHLIPDAAAGWEGAGDTVLISGENDAAGAISVPRHVVDERFVGFAFAGADLVAEIDGDGIVTYADGAFRSLFGRPPEAFIGHRVQELVAAVDHEALDAALTLLIERGRLSPLVIRLSVDTVV
jgi:PAS domain-containing protein